MPPWGVYRETRTKGLPPSHLYYSYGVVLVFFVNLSDKHVVTLAVEHVPSAVMEPEAHFPSGCPPLQLGVGLYWCSSGGPSLIRPKPKAPRLHQFASAFGTRFASIHRVRMCRRVVPTASCVPPNVVPPASRVPPLRHCTFSVLTSFQL